MNDLCRTDKRIQKKKTVKNDINSTVGGFKKGNEEVLFLCMTRFVKNHLVNQK